MAMAERDSGAKRGLFRRGARTETEAPAADTPAVEPAARRGRSTGDMFNKPANDFDDPWSSDAWAEDGWNDEWADPKSRASIRPAAAPRSAAVDAWLESDQTEFADATADMARKWVPDSGRGPGATWDEPEKPVAVESNRPTTELFTTPVETPTVETTTVSPEIPKISAFDTSRLNMPNVEFPKVDAPKIDAPADVSKLEVPKLEVPKLEVPKADVSKLEVPKVEVPKVEVPKLEVAKVDASKIDMPAAPVAAAGIVMTPKSEPAPVETPVAEIPKVPEVVKPEPLGAPSEPAVTPAPSFNDAQRATAPLAAETAPAVPVLPVGSTWDAEPLEPTPSKPTPTVAATSIVTPPIVTPPIGPASQPSQTKSADSILGAGWDDEDGFEEVSPSWADDPVVRSLDEDFVQDVSDEIAIDRSMPAEADRRTIPRSVPASTPSSILPNEYDDLDRSIDLDLAEELDHELPTFVRHERKGPGSVPAKAKTRKPEPAATAKRAPIGSGSPQPPLAKITKPVSGAAESVAAAPVAAKANVVIDDDVWDDVDPNAVAASRLDEQLGDPDSDRARLRSDTGSDNVRPAKRTAPNVPALKPKPVDTEVSAPTTSSPQGRKWSPAPTNATDLSIVRLLMTSGLALAGVAVLRLILALIATVKATTDTHGFGDRLVDAANNLGTEQGVLLVLAVTFAILGRYVAHGRIESVNRLTGRACGVILGAASATLLLAVARLINNLGVDGATFASSAQAAVEFLAIGGISLVAISAAWSTSAE
jgi:hypothetical protein